MCAPQPIQQRLRLRSSTSTSTVIMTSNEDEDLEDRGRQHRQNIPSEHLGIETLESDRSFHMVAKPGSRHRNNDINHQSPTSASPGHSTSTASPSRSMTLLNTSHHLLQQDPYDLPDYLWLTPSTSSISSSSGGHRSEDIGVQLDRIHAPHGNNRIYLQDWLPLP